MFIFDGFDELYSIKIRPKLKELDTFINLFGKNKFIITSRPGTNIQRFSRFKNAEIMELSIEELPIFIKQQIQNKKLAMRVAQNIFSDENTAFMHFLKNPLLLSMYIFTFTSHPELPREKKEFYENIFKTLYEKHDGKMKDGFARERLTKLKRSDFEIILQRFSFKSYFKGVFEFSESYLEKTLSEIRRKENWVFEISKLIRDLETGISILVQDNAIFKFPHRSIQEYFVAACINSFPENIKKVIFNDKLDSFIEVTTDSLMNLWDLCNEFDRYSFLEHFILKNFTEKFIKLFNQPKKDLYKLFIPIFEPMIVLPEKKSSGLVQAFSINYNSKNYNIVKFTNMTFEQEFIIPGTKLTPHTEYFYLLSKDNNIINLIDYIDDEQLFILLDRIEFIDKIKSEITKLQNEYRKLLLELKSYKKSYDEWLSIISS